MNNECAICGGEHETQKCERLIEMLRSAAHLMSFHVTDRTLRLTAEAGAAANIAAADEIEELRAFRRKIEIAIMGDDRARCTDDELIGIAEDEKGAFDKLALVEAVEEERDALRAEIQRLREALEAKGESE